MKPLLFAALLALPSAILAVPGSSHGGTPPRAGPLEVTALPSYDATRLTAPVEAATVPAPEVRPSDLTPLDLYDALFLTADVEATPVSVSMRRLVIERTCGRVPEEPWTGEPDEFASLAPHARGEVAIVGTADPQRDDAATAAVREAARAVSDCWRRGGAAEAEALVAATPRLVMWDRAGDAVRLAGWFRSNRSAARLGVTVARSKAAGAIGVVFPPGTYGVAPHVQDLAFLRAAVIVLGPDDREARIEFPVACASFHANGPRAGHGYTLRRFPAGSRVTRLLVSLCAGDPAPERAAQLGLWITADHITRTQLTAKSWLRTFDSFLLVGLAPAEEAAELLRKAGLESRPAPFFSPAP